MFIRAWRTSAIPAGPGCWNYSNVHWIIVAYFHSYSPMLNNPVRGKRYTGNCCTSAPCWMGNKPQMIFCKILCLLFCFSSPSCSICLLPICILSQDSEHTMFFSCRVAIRLGGNRRSTVRHILRRVSFSSLLTDAISKQSSHQHQLSLFHHTCSSQMQTSALHQRDQSTHYTA